MEKRTKQILIALFIVTVIVRLILAFITPNFTYESYYHLRQVESITETGLPLYHDDLSYGGRDLLFLPFFHYFMALFSLFLPLTFAAKVLPNILVATMVVTSYFISKKITNNETASLLSAMIVGFLPILFNTNSFTIETLFFPMIFVAIYAFLNVRDHTKEKKFLFIYIASFLILSITSSLTALLLIGFGIYLLLSVLEGKKINKTELEVILFSLFFFLWVQFIFFKNSLIQEGISFVWQNVPSKIITEYFPKFSIGEALLLVSFIPFLAGIFVAYRSLFQLKNQKSFLLISFVIAATLLTWFRLIRFRQSLTFFGVILAILFAPFYQDLEKYAKKTKLAHLKRFILPFVVLVLLISTVLPAITTALSQNTPTKEEITAFKWLQDNTPEEATVFGTLEEGHLITYYGKRKNIIDDRFMLIKDVNKRFQASDSLFVTPFGTQALGISDEYNLEYLVLTPSAKERYDLARFNFPERCIKRIYKNETKIYLVKCELKET